MEQFIRKIQADRSEIEVAVFESRDKERIASMLVIRSGNSAIHIIISAEQMRALALELVEGASHKELEVHRRTAAASKEAAK